MFESKQEFSEVYPRKSKLQKRPESSSSCYECKVCGKIFGCYRGLGGHTKLHRSTKRELASTQDENSLLDSSEAKKIVSQPSSFKVSQEEKFLHCVELKQDFSEPLSHSGALPSTLRSKLQTKTQWKSSCHCKICGKSFVCSQGLGNHKRVHREISGKLACKRKYTEDYNPFSDSLKAKKIVKKPSSFEVSQEEKILHCVELKQDFGELLAHSGFDKSISCSKSIKVKKVARKNEKTEDSTSLFGVIDSEASKFASLPSSIEIYHEKTFHCVESKQDFSELFSR